jgi:mRNA export factor
VIADLRQASAGDIGSSTQQIAQHADTIKSAKWFQTAGNDYVATGSWDKTVKFWDLRSPNPAGTLDVGERVYTMDVKYSPESKRNLLVIGTANRHIHMVNLDDPGKIYKTIQSPLKWQTRVVSCFSDASGFAIGSIEGRCAIQYVEEKDTAYGPSSTLTSQITMSGFLTRDSLNFSFKCHRQQDTTQRDVAKVYSVNAISFHPQHGTFSTAGSDGTFHFWDKDAKHRLKGYPEVGGSITATGFNYTGNIFAYAISYDWSKGYSFNNPQQPIKVKLHPINGDECKPRQGSKKR